MEFKDKPNIIRYYILNDAVYKVENFEKLVNIGGKYIFAYQSKDTFLSSRLYYGKLDPFDYFSDVIERTGIFKLFINHSDGDELHYIAGVKTEDEAVDKMIYEEVESVENLDDWKTEFTSSLPYEDIDEKLKRAIKYFELMVYYKKYMEERFIDKHKFYQKLGYEYTDKIFNIRDLLVALNSGKVHKIFNVINTPEFEEFIKVIYKNPKTCRNRELVGKLLSIVKESGFLSKLDTWNLEELKLLKEFANIVKNWNQMNFERPEYIIHYYNLI